MRIKVDRQITNRITSYNLNPILTIIINGDCSFRREDGFSISTNDANKLLYLQKMQNILNKSALTRKTEFALSRLEEFETLKQNWDSYGASPLDKDSIDEARTILRRAFDYLSSLRIPELEFYPIPNTSGGVSIYFHLEEKELRIKLYPHENKKIVYLVDKMYPEKYHYREESFNLAHLSKHFIWLSSNDRGVFKWIPPLSASKTETGSFSGLTKTLLIQPETLPMMSFVRELTHRIERTTVVRRV